MLRPLYPLRSAQPQARLVPPPGTRPRLAPRLRPAHLARRRRGPALPGPGHLRGRTRAARCCRRRARCRSCGGPSAPVPLCPAAGDRALPVARGAGPPRSPQLGRPRGAAGPGRGSLGGGRPGGWRRPVPVRGLRGASLSPTPPRSRRTSWWQSCQLGSISPSHRARDADEEGRRSRGAPLIHSASHPGRPPPAPLPAGGRASGERRSGLPAAAFSGAGRESEWGCCPAPCSSRSGSPGGALERTEHRPSRRVFWELSAALLPLPGPVLSLMLPQAPIPPRFFLSFRGFSANHHFPCPGPAAAAPSSPLTAAEEAKSGPGRGSKGLNGLVQRLGRQRDGESPRRIC